MKIYTQTGDRGKTSLFSGERIFKDHVRVRAYGEVDELNAVIGSLAASLRPEEVQVVDELKRIQSRLFQVGAWLATTPGTEAQSQLTPITKEDTSGLETRIDAMESNLPDLRAFVLPGGHPSAAWAHIARAVCRRVERTVVELAGQQSPSESPENLLAPIMAFLNRLSDYLFVLARFLNQQNGVAEVVWQE